MKLILQSGIAVSPFPEFGAVDSLAWLSFFILAANDRNKGTVHMWRFLIHMNRGRYNVLLSADFHADKPICVLEELSCPICADTVKEIGIRCNQELAENCALLLPVQPEIALQMLLFPYHIESIQITAGRFFQVIIHRGTSLIDVLITVILVVPFIMAFRQWHDADLMILVSDDCKARDGFLLSVFERHCVLDLSWVSGNSES